MHRLVELLANQSFVVRRLESLFYFRRSIIRAPFDGLLLLERQPHDVRPLAFLDLSLCIPRSGEDLVVEEIKIELLLYLVCEIIALLLHLLEKLHLLPVVVLFHRSEQDFLGARGWRLEEFRTFCCRWVCHRSCFFRMLFHLINFKIKIRLYCPRGLIINWANSSN